jgi:hypothetical protein
MHDVIYTFQSGDNVETATARLPVSPRPDFESCGIFAFPKSGSVLVNAIVSDLMAEAGIAVMDWPQIWFTQGINSSTVRCDLQQAFPSNGYCFSGFRGIPISFFGAPALTRLRKILIVRDPRDMLVSRYFSTKFSHGFDTEKRTSQFSRMIGQIVEDTGTDIDKYSLFYSWAVNAEYFFYRDIIADPKTLVIKYEDFVYDRSHLASAICSWVGLDISRERILFIVEPYDSIPATEQPTKHVRQAHPGDYRRKLNPTTISALNGVLGEFLAKFGYRME